MIYKKFYWDNLVSIRRKNFEFLVLKKILVNNKYIMLFKFSNITNIQLLHKLVYNIFLYQLNVIYLMGDFLLKYLYFYNNLNLNFLSKNFIFLIVYTDNYFKLYLFLLDYYKFEKEKKYLNLTAPFLIKICKNLILFNNFLKLFSELNTKKFIELNIVEFYKKFFFFFFFKFFLN